MTFDLTGDDVPKSGNDYAIHIYGSKKAVTVCFEKNDNAVIKLVDFSGDGKQRWNCQGGDKKDDPLGFACGSAYNGVTRYLGFNVNEELRCYATEKDNWEYFWTIDAFGGGFKLMMKKDDHHAPVEVVNTDRLKMLRDSNAVFGFTKWK
jgi:hypothetical protein